MLLESQTKMDGTIVHFFYVSLSSEALVQAIQNNVRQHSVQ